jgi:hypothetical protein
VNPEQASKVEMRVPIRPKDGEGRSGEREGTETHCSSARRGTGNSTR